MSFGIRNLFPKILFYREKMDVVTTIKYKKNHRPSGFCTKPFVLR